jgi:hypothetical protein
MSVVYSSLSVSQLLDHRSKIDSEIVARSGGSVVTESKKTRKVSKNKGLPTAWGAFSSKVQKEHQDEIKALKDASPGEKSVHLKFASKYKEEHMDEYQAFLTQFNQDHPKNNSASVVSEDSESGAEKSDKPKRVMTDEHKAKMKAGREKKAAENKAAKEAEEATARNELMPAPEPSKKQGKKAKKAEEVVPTPAPVQMVMNPEEVESDDLPEFLPFKKGGSTFLRLGVKREDGNHLWDTGFLWQCKKDGSRGVYVGCLDPLTGVIDNKVSEPEMEEA